MSSAPPKGSPVQYGLAFGYFVGKKPNGWTSLLLATLCELIPVIGPLVTLGYRAEVTDRLLRDPDLRDHPDFTFDRFSKYLERGIWPFLVALLASLVAMPIFMVAWFAIFFGVAGQMPVVGIAVGFGVVLLGSVFLAAVVTPLVFHAELAGKLDVGGGLRFTLDFWRRCGGAAVLAYVLFAPLALGVTLLGLLACFVGIYPAATIVQMAAQHLMTQLYALYLDRGGADIERAARPRYDVDEYDDDEYEIDDDRRR